MKTKQILLMALLALGTLNSEFSTARAQGTAFTYQGQLSSNGVPLNGNYDFEFSLYPNAAGTGSPLGTGTATQTDIGVTNGLFTTTLNFGAVFTGNATWLAISVRSNNVGSYTALTPLQELTPVPYAIYTLNAGSAVTATSATTAAIAATANNVASGIAITNAFITNSVFAGNGGGLTNLNAARLSGSVPAGVSVPSANLTGALPAISGASLINLNPADLSAGTAGINISGNAQTATTATLADNVVLGINITNAFITGATLTNTTFDFSPTITMTSGGLPFWYSDSAQNLFIGLYANYFSNIGEGGAANTGFGTYAFEDIGSGNGNTGIGWSALYSVTKGSYNTALGYEALDLLTTGTNNVAVGYQAGLGLMGNESNNIYIGNYGNPGENNTIRIGTNGVQTAAYIAGVINGNGGGLTNLNAARLSGSVPAGVSVPSANLTGALPAISGASLINLNPADLSAGTAGINISGNAQTATTATLADNVVLGINITNAFITGATLTNTTFDFSPTITMTSGGLPFWYSDSAQNLFIGLYANYFSNIGEGGAANTGFGTYAFEDIGSGNGNTGIGWSALYSVTKGSYNTALGYEALDLLTTGTNNVAVGYQAGLGLMGNESNNIYIGNYGNPGENNTIRIGTNGVQTAAYIAGVINGNGGGLTSLNASQLTSGIIPNNVLPGFQSSSNYSSIGGGQNNTVSGSTDSVIAGGQNNTLTNVTGSAIAGGVNNTNNGNQSTIGGGAGNVIQVGAYYALLGSGGGNVIATNSDTAFLGAGYHNLIGTNAPATVLGGGQYNVISNNATFSVLGGGYQNTNTGPYSMIPGGINNLAASYSFAAGSNALAVHSNAFVWSDGSASTTSTNTNSVTFRAAGGYRLFTSSGAAGAFLGANQTSWSAISDRNAKKNFQPVDTKAVLDKLAAIPIQQWNYKWENDGDVPNIGPMAQDFKAAFYPGRDDKSISTLEFDGVELAAIQGLNQKVDQQSSELKEKDAEIEKLKAKANKVDLLEKQLNELKQMVQLLAERK